MTGILSLFLITIIQQLDYYLLENQFMPRLACAKPGVYTWNLSDLKLKIKQTRIRKVCNKFASSN